MLFIWSHRPFVFWNFAWKYEPIVLSKFVFTVRTVSSWVLQACQMDSWKDFRFFCRWLWSRLPSSFRFLMAGFIFLISEISWRNCFSFWNIFDENCGSSNFCFFFGLWSCSSKNSKIWLVCLFFIKLLASFLDKTIFRNLLSSSSWLISSKLVNKWALILVLKFILPDENSLFSHLFNMWICSRHLSKKIPQFLEHYLLSYSQLDKWLRASWYFKIKPQDS